MSSGLENIQYRTGYPNPGYIASLEGRSICLKVNGKTGIATQAVLTDSTFLQPIGFGERLVLTCFYMYLSTVSDWVTVEFGVTEHDNGSGNFTSMTPLFRLDTGDKKTDSSPSVTPMNPPMVLTRAHGGAFTARVQGNDATAALTLGVNGWTEDIRED